MKRSEKSIREAEEYLEAANESYGRVIESDDRPWNPVVVQCILVMIKTTDALMLEKRGQENTDHSKTAKALRGMYEDGLISDGFKSNVDSVRRWVVDEKTAIQYRNEYVSQKDATQALKAAERFLKKAKGELDH